MNVRFCPFCRSLILADFRYCPYCGQSVAVKGPGLSEALNGAFGNMGEGAQPVAGRGVAVSGVDVFASARESLERLEADMDLLLDEMEKEGRSST
jgi:hypothetical protein